MYMKDIRFILKSAAATEREEGEPCMWQGLMGFFPISSVGKFSNCIAGGQKEGNFFS